MIGKLLLATLGFDEKFIIRFLIRHGANREDKIVILFPTGSQQSEKTTKALETIKKVTEVPIEDLAIDLLNPKKMFRKIERVISSPAYQEVIVFLSGGMRILLLITLLAIFLSRRLNIQVEIDSEDGDIHLSVPMAAIFAPPNKRKLLILQGIKNGQTLTEISKNTGFSKATVSREVSQLESLGLVVDNKLTTAGHFYIELYDTELNY
ncbi:MAG: CRISPR-associated CARF protein Csa3 [Nitrososphaerota archaeon]